MYKQYTLSIYCYDLFALFYYNIRLKISERAKSGVAHMRIDGPKSSSNFLAEFWLKKFRTNPHPSKQSGKHNLSIDETQYGTYFCSKDYQLSTILKC